MAETQFPSIAQSESVKKSSKYYRDFLEAIVRQNFNSAYTTNYNKLSMLYNFYKIGTGSDLTGYLQTAPDGSAMPGIWTSHNSVHTRLQSLIGELEERGYVIKAKALNSEAEARKFEERERLRIERHLAPTRQYAEGLTGLKLGSEEYIPQTDQELDEFMDLTWKDKHVQIIEAALKWIAHRNNWDDQRIALFVDRLIANISITRHEIVRGVPRPRRVDPLKFIFDPHSTGDLLEDATYFGEVDYVPLASAAERYGLSLTEMQEAYQEYTNFLGMGMEARGECSYFNCMPGQTLKWFKTEDGVPRCLVIKACWRDIKVLSHKNEKKEKYDTEYLQDVTGEDVKKKDKDKIIHNKIECWRQGTLIGGKFLREWGECPNQPRELNSLQITRPPYEVWRDHNSISILERLVTPQVLKDIAMYQLQIQMARAIGKVLVFDEAFMPEGQSKDQVMSRMKADGIVWVNSKEYQMSQGNLNLFKEYDLSLSESIAQSIQIIAYLDSQIDAISGVGPERQGVVQGASQAVGVTNSALAMQSLITAPQFRGFDRYCSRILTHQAALVKMAWSDGSEKFAPIIGDVGVDFLREFVDISLDEFGVIVESLPPLVQDRQKLEQIVSIALQTGELPLTDAIAILLESDLTVAVRKFSRRFALRQMEASRQEQMQMQAEQDMAAQQTQMQQQLSQQNAQLQLQLQQMKGQNNMQKTLATSRTKLQSEKLRLLS